MSGRSRQCHNLPGVHFISLGDEYARGVAVHGLVPINMGEKHKEAVLGVVAGTSYCSATRGSDRRSDGNRDVDSRMCLIGASLGHLAARHHPFFIQWPSVG